MSTRTSIKNLSILSAAIALIAVCFGVVNQAGAQTGSAQLLVTWQADTYVPDGYPGKVLPTSDSSILAGVDLIDGGRRVDLSTYKVFWYLDDKFYQGATGLTRISLAAPHFIGRSSINVRVTVTNYGAGLGKTVIIPVVPPEVTIQASASNLSAGVAPFSLRAYPYFFNVKDPSMLNFSWKLNGAVVGAQNPFVVTREMAADGISTIEVGVSNPNRPIERLTRKLNIFE